MDLRANIVEKRGTLQVVVTYKDILGVSRQRWRDTKLKKKGNKKRAEKIKNEFLAELEKEFAEKENEHKTHFDWEQKIDITFFDYLHDYLKIAKHNVSELTFISYHKLVETRIKHFFETSRLPLTSLRPIHLQKFYESILDDGCTANTAIHYHAYIRKALQHAVNMDYIPNNIADRVAKPKKRQFIPQFYTSKELNELLAAIEGEKIWLVVLLTGFYGLRRSEVLGLKWDAFDFVNKKFKIKHVVLEDPREYGRLIKKNQTKNDPSYRSMPLIPYIEEKIMKQKEWQQQNRKLFGDNYLEEDSEYVFTMEDGRIMHPSYVSNRTKTLMKRNHLRVIRFHDLRHSNASIMLDEGQDMKRIQEWLGHASFTTTANLYAHLTPGFKNEAANSLEKVFGFNQKDTKKEPHSSKK